jgi:carbonic anhydrase
MEDTSSSKIKVVVLRCMDRRLNEEMWQNKEMKELLKNYKSSEIMVLGNAGGDVERFEGGLKRILIENPNVELVIPLEHGKKCGGMNILFSMFHDENGDKRLLNAYGEGFLRLMGIAKKAKDRKELEEVENPAAQVKMVNEIIEILKKENHEFGERMKSKKILVKSVLALRDDGEETKAEPAHGEHDEKHFVFVTNETVSDYKALAKKYNLNLKDTYMIQYYKDINEVKRDIRIAVDELKCSVIVSKGFADLNALNKIVPGVSVSELSQSKVRSVN